MKCSECHKDFPAHLINLMHHMGEVTQCCPICALKIRNQDHGLPKNTKFQGEMANAMWEEAIEYERRRNEGC